MQGLVSLPNPRSATPADAGLTGPISASLRDAKNFVGAASPCSSSFVPFVSLGYLSGPSALKTRLLPPRSQHQPPRRLRRHGVIARAFPSVAPSASAGSGSLSRSALLPIPNAIRKDLSHCRILA